MQGGERKVVLYYVYKSKHTPFLTNPITYVSISRAKEEVIIINCPDVVAKSVSNIKPKPLETLELRLKERLPEEFKLAELNQMELEKKLIREELDKKFREEYGDEYDDTGCGDDDYTDEEIEFIPL